MDEGISNDAFVFSYQRKLKVCEIAGVCEAHFCSILA